MKYEFEIDPDRHIPDVTICSVHREIFRIARDQVALNDKASASAIMELTRQAFDMGKRMDRGLKGKKK